MFAYWFGPVFAILFTGGDEPAPMLAVHEPHYSTHARA